MTKVDSQEKKEMVNLEFLGRKRSRKAWLGRVICGVRVRDADLRTAKGRVVWESSSLGIVLCCAIREGMRGSGDQGIRGLLCQNNVVVVK